MSDAVDHPTHYNSNLSGVECIDVVEHMTFNIGSAIKYLWRADHKGRQREDLQKALWYIDRELKRYAEGYESPWIVNPGLEPIIPLRRAADFMPANIAKAVRILGVISSIEDFDEAKALIRTHILNIGSTIAAG